MAPRNLLSLLGTASILVLPLGCGSGEPDALAVVNGQRIEHEQVESLIELYKGRAEAREGERKKGKEEVTHAQELAALQVLVQRAVLEQKARQLGVTVDPKRAAEAAERLEGGETAAGDQEQDEETKELDEQIRETARAQLLREALYERVTRGVRIPRSKVLAYYRQHRSTYPGGGREPAPQAERVIRRGLTTIEREKLFAQWVAGAQRAYAPKVRYEQGWAPRR